MAKRSSDVILRDRMQFTLDSAGDKTTVYGRINLDDYVNAVEGNGLNIKEVFIQPRLTTTGNQGLANTGAFTPLAATPSVGASSSQIFSALKVYATTRAYENAIDVGIASPDVFHMEEWVNAVYQNANSATAGRGLSVQTEHSRYGPTDLHPDGYTVVSDILIGVAADNIDYLDDEVIELDVMIIGQPVNVTKSDLMEMLTQAQDL